MCCCLCSERFIAYICRHVDDSFLFCAWNTVHFVFDCQFLPNNASRFLLFADHFSVLCKFNLCINANISPYDLVRLSMS